MQWRMLLFLYIIKMYHVKKEICRQWNISKKWDLKNMLCICLRNYPEVRNSGLP